MKNNKEGELSTQNLQLIYNNDVAGVYLVFILNKFYALFYDVTAD